MANGKEKIWIEDGIKFVNPYNFVSLGHGPKRRMILSILLYTFSQK